MFEDQFATVDGITYGRTLGVDEHAFHVDSTSVSPMELARVLETGLSGGGHTAVFVPSDAAVAYENAIGVVFIEDWRAECFPWSIHEDGEDAREAHMQDRFDSRKDKLHDNAPISDGWLVLREELAAPFGGGRYGQTQYAVVAPTWAESHLDCSGWPSAGQAT